MPFVHSVTECVPPSMSLATHLVPGLWITCQRRSSPNLMQPKCKRSRKRGSSISSLRRQSSRRWTWSTLSNRPSCLLVPLAHPNKTTTVTYSPNPTPSLTRHPVLSGLRHHAPSVLPLRVPSVPTPPGLSVLIPHASCAGQSRDIVSCPAMTIRYVLSTLYFKDRWQLAHTLEI